MIRMTMIMSACLATTRVQADPTPQQRAAAVLKAQLAAVPGHEDALIATFAPNAVVLLPQDSTLADDHTHNLGNTISSMHPHATFISGTSEHLVAGGNANVVWFSADLTFVISSSEGASKATKATFQVRAVELLDAAAGWKPVVAAFSRVAKLSYYSTPRGEVPAPTTAGPLAKLVASPDALAAALAPDAVVLGTDPGERAVGKAAAQKMLAKWTKLGLALEPADKVHEVATKTYAYVVANVNLPNETKGEPPYRMNALVIAIPAGTGWQVEVATYGAM